MANTTLVLAATDDGEARRVANELRRRGREPLLLDLSWFPQRAAVTAQLGASGWEGRITTPDTSIALEDVTSVYHRRCPPFELPVDLTEPEQRFAGVEGRFGLGGVLSSLNAHWVSHPAAMADAEYTPVQLAAARRVELPVPQTWIGNNPSAARDFVTDHTGGAVYKPFMHKLISDQGHARLIYTSHAAAEDIDERISTTTHQFQSRVHADHDVRAVITRHGCEAVAITAKAGAAFLDYRAHYDALQYRRATLPPDIIASSQNLLKDLRLTSGVFDFAVSKTGETAFYEVNPAGQWAWLEEETGAPMTSLICDELTGAAP